MCVALWQLWPVDDQLARTTGKRDRRSPANYGESGPPPGGAFVASILVLTPVKPTR